MEDNKINYFINLCKEFESLVKTKYGLEDKDSAYYFLCNQKEFVDFKNEINIIRSLRNVFQHVNTTINGMESVEVNDVLIETAEKIIDLLENPILAEDVCVKAIYTVSLDSTIKEVIQNMGKKKISHVPILNNDQEVIGAFSANTIFSKLSTGEKIEEDQTVNDYQNFIGLEDHYSEAFGFVAQNQEVEEFKSLFAKDEKHAKRVVMLFVTKTGKPNEKLVGIITPWDLM